MKSVIVKSHRRIGKNNLVKVVKSHVRKVKDKYGIKTPIKVNLKHKADQHDSLAHLATAFDKSGEGKYSPKSHTINVDVDKINRTKADTPENVVRHELGHVVDTELVKNNMPTPHHTFSKTSAGKKMLMQHRRSAKSKRRSAKELFADTFTI
jgi:hypothetical protein